MFTRLSFIRGNVDYIYHSKSHEDEDEDVDVDVDVDATVKLANCAQGQC